MKLSVKTKSVREVKCELSEFMIFFKLKFSNAAEFKMLLKESIYIMMLLLITGPH